MPGRQDKQLTLDPCIDRRDTMGARARAVADLPVYSAADVAAHNSEGDLWMIIKGKVYDVTNYLAEHPGGDIMLVRVLMFSPDGPSLLAS